MNFIIRDDDLNYFSTPEDIEWWYEDIFNMGIPVNFAAIPFVKPVSDVYTGEKKGGEEEYPISENKRLVEYVKNHDLIYIMQHGCTHETKDGVFEYASNDYESLLKKTKRGKRELEQAFEQDIEVFVPPHDSISNNGIKVLEKKNLNLIRGRGCKNILFRRDFIKNFFIMTSHVLKNLNKKFTPAFPKNRKFKKHSQAYSYRLENDNLNELKKGLKYAHKKNGTFIITNHIHNKNKKRKENIIKLTKIAKKHNANFVTTSEIF
jgi:hypothetical protein